MSRTWKISALALLTLAVFAASKIVELRIRPAGHALVTDQTPVFERIIDGKGSAVAKLAHEAEGLRRRGDCAAAARKYREALRQGDNPSDKAAVQIALANTLTENGDFGEAIEEADRLITQVLRDPNSGLMSIYGMSAAIAKSNAIAKERSIPSISVLRSLAEQSSGQEKALYLFTLAAAHFEEGRPEEAKPIFQKVLAQHPSTVWSELSAEGLKVVERKGTGAHHVSP